MKTMMAQMLIALEPRTVGRLWRRLKRNRVLECPNPRALWKPWVTEVARGRAHSGRLIGSAWVEMSNVELVNGHAAFSPPLGPISLTGGERELPHNAAEFWGAVALLPSRHQ